MKKIVLLFCLVPFAAFAQQMGFQSLQASNSIENQLNAKHVQNNDISQNQKLDSIIYESGSGVRQKEVLHYDDFGNVDNKMLYLSPNTSNPSWSKYSKADLKYNNQKKLLGENEFHWNQVSQSWVEMKKNEWNYDANGNRINYSTLSWNEVDNQWDSGSRYETSYNKNGLPGTEVYLTWESGSNQFRKVSKTSTGYDDDGRLSIEIEYFWNAKKGDWEPLKKQNIVHGPDNYGSVLVSVWDAQTNRWKNDQSYRYVYDSNQKKTVTSIFSWIQETNEWINLENYRPSFDEKGRVVYVIGNDRSSAKVPWEPFRKLKYTYDENNHLVLEECYSWDMDIFEWVGYYRTSYQFDSGNNKTEEAHYGWDKTNKQWENGLKNEYSYTGSGLLKSFSHSEWMEGQWYLNNRETRYYRESGVAANRLVDERSVYAYPNPATESVFFDVSEHDSEKFVLRLLDFSGKMVLSCPIKSQEPVSIRNVSPGTYVYSLSSENKTFNGKLVVK